MRRALPLIVLVALAAAAPADAAVKLPDGATVAGVDLGGLYRHAARVELIRRLTEEYARPVAVRIRQRRVKLPTGRLGQRIRYTRMLDRAFLLARRGAVAAVPLKRAISSARLTRAIERLGRPWYRAARNARAVFGIRRVHKVRGRRGRMLDATPLRHALVGELWRPTRARTVRAHLLHPRPAVRVRTLRRIHRTYISVDRGSRLVRLFKRLRHVRTFRVAVGAAGYDTPAGLHHVLSKQRDPTWYVPSRPWAGSLAGQVIPPGDPRNPLKARFISLGGGVGFHGTADLASIGQAASHGCIRMTVPDVIALYNRTPVGTPVLIR
ncbi:MAG: L,D-transpeptidase ErfK/SrfK [Thermoleophilaceae bacterium]|nr:L,D-transpeptidase ErfK/SrfK [Thermoleophilaceae bacterium]